MAAAVLIFSSQAAWAHTLWTNPTPRNMDDGLKSGPCGGVARTDAPLELESGSTMTMAWAETIDHPGHYRIALSGTGDQDFESNILVDNILDEDCNAPPCQYTATVTLPMVECENCTLQLIQFMGQGTDDPYFSCADVTLMGAPVVFEPDPQPNQEPVPMDDDFDNLGAPIVGGCQGSPGAQGLTLAFALLLGAWVRRRRPARRRRA